MALEEIRIPDLEGETDVAVVEIYVSPGDEIEPETPIISLESEKAVMDVPSPLSGTISAIKISEGDTVNAGDVIALVEVTPKAETRDTPSSAPPASRAVENELPADLSDSVSPIPPSSSQKTAPSEKSSTTPRPPSPQLSPTRQQQLRSPYHATPSLRAFARELGVDLASVSGSGPKGRITREDVTNLVKKTMSGSGASGFALPPIPSADFAAFGEIESVPLSRIQKISGPHLHRNWIGVPHVTQFEEADITDLEEFRKKLNAVNEQSGRRRISPLIFIIKALTHTLKEFPDFNGSLSSDGVTLIRKKYINIGIAVDTPGGLLVPVIPNADGRGVQELADMLRDLSSRAREGKLTSNELKGATFTISNLGGIGGTYFTPIINAPELAILGLSKSAMKPLWNGSNFEPRLILPFSLSYDHRVIDGAQGARFTAALSKTIGDMRRVLL